MPLWRPPSEAESLIIQATLGCSFNRCSFCSMYREKDFVARPLEEVQREIVRLGRSDHRVRRVFLADGDAMTLPTDHLLALLESLAQAFPDLQRVASYAWPLNILKKSDAELESLRAARLSLVYLGLESGSARLLKKITKGANPAMMRETIDRCRAAGIKVSATTILGLGGERHSAEHVRETAALVSASPPNYLSTLQIGLAPIIREEFFRKFKEPFQTLDDAGMLAELEALVASIAPRRPVIFRSNHASNALPLGGTLPKDQERLLHEIREVREGRGGIVPPWLRGY
ncbi:MAG: radical SAM protein [Planctomycetes bacterium]|nr:radical SAM protein [Planctomycetota bacterium]